MGDTEIKSTCSYSWTPYNKAEAISTLKKRTQKSRRVVPKKWTALHSPHFTASNRRSLRAYQTCKPFWGPWRAVNLPAPKNTSLRCRRDRSSSLSASSASHSCCRDASALHNPPGEGFTVWPLYSHWFNYLFFQTLFLVSHPNLSKLHRLCLPCHQLELLRLKSPQEIACCVSWTVAGDCLPIWFCTLE